MAEALDLLEDEGIHLDTLRVRGFPFGDEVYRFIDRHDVVFVVDQNRDGQMRTLLVNEGDLDPARLLSVRYFGGLSISADAIQEQVSEHYTAQKLPRLTEVKS
jgi:2-oxoglutarate ferredoxin oxidoreductase subunit alpha